jgi:hypothetical protein
MRMNHPLIDKIIIIVCLIIVLSCNQEENIQEYSLDKDFNTFIDELNPDYISLTSAP